MTLIGGIGFNYDGDFQNIIKALSYNQSFNDHQWTVDCLWIEGPTGESYKEMNDQTFAGNALLSKFSCLDENFVFFIRMREYSVSDDIDCISTFEDFEKSKCLMVILVTDSNFYEVYAKNEEELLSLQGNLASLLSIDAKIIPMNSITRTELTV